MATREGEESGDSLLLLRFTPYKGKPGHRSRAVPGFVGVRRQARTLAGWV
ncbi:MAG: hypothetical protein QOF47_2798 [Mycobacterium sp.]|jgi:hypothetical protein|nr:hypothetical protein [Mycobacterium sp.]MDT5331967.1 hypothetical protein [Mycobacterium sp.]